MLVICEDCSKKYNIDENKIKGEKAQFTCRACNHVMVISKPQALQKEQEPETDKPSEPAQEMSQPAAEQLKAGKGVPVSAYISLTLVIGFVAVVGAFTLLYLNFIPGIINKQVELRTLAVAQALSGSIQKPLMLRNYLQVNKEAQRISRIPGVAYVAVINKRGMPIAGFFSDLHRFTPAFGEQVKSKGFPRDVITLNQLDEGSSHKNARISVGGQPIVDQAMVIKETGSHVRVGVFISEVNDGIRSALFSPLTIGTVCALLLIGLILLLLLTKTLVKPMQELTENARRISVGQLDLTITPRGPREMRELARAFARMQQSIKSALERLK